MMPLLKRMWGYEHPNLAISRMGIEFSNPVGLAAGFDKNGSHIQSMAALGFGFIEVGTVTPLPQPGNDQPRLFRLPKDHALINRMGFNNQGVDHLIENLDRLPSTRPIIGGNIGKNKLTPNEDAMQDYLTSFVKLHSRVDYFVVNVSSPNTPGLRSLQEKKPLTEILTALQEYNRNQILYKPLLLKISPDLTLPQLDDVLSVVHDQKLDGLIATNTTLKRDGLSLSAESLDQIGAGGLSGAPMHKFTRASIRYVRQHTKEEFTIIGVGGIECPDGAKRLLDDGANLLQLYTGLIYSGPGLVGQINRALAARKSKIE
jgi:dihydroorotate dehydrogenase